MDPLTIITSTLGILSAVDQAYSGIQKLVNLPEAFKEVVRQLPLAEQLLNAAEIVLKDNPDAKTAASDCLADCRKKAIALRNTFEKLKDRTNTAKEAAPSNDGEGQVEWLASSLVETYKTSLLRVKRMAKANKVEKLMRDIMEKLETLSTLQGFKSAVVWQDKLEEITASIEALTGVAEQHPSIDDEELPGDEDGCSSFQQNIDGHGTGYQSHNTNMGSGDSHVVQGVGGENNQVSFGRHAQTHNNYGSGKRE